MFHGIIYFEKLIQLRENKLERHTNVLPIDSQSLKQQPSFSPLRGDEIRLDDRLKSRSQLERVGEYEPDILIHRDRDLQTQTGQQVRMNISSTRNAVEVHIYLKKDIVRKTMAKFLLMKIRGIIIDKEVNQIYLRNREVHRMSRVGSQLI